LGRLWPPLPSPAGGNGVEYNSDFRYDLKVGQVSEKRLGELLTDKTIEVKRDFRASRTGKVFVEFFCRGKPSGISTTEADFWAFMITDETVVILPTRRLKKLVREAKKKGDVVSGGDSNLSQGALVEIERLMRDAIRC